MISLFDEINYEQYFILLRYYGKYTSSIFGKIDFVFSDLYVVLFFYGYFIYLFMSLKASSKLLLVWFIESNIFDYANVFVCLNSFGLYAINRDVYSVVVLLCKIKLAFILEELNFYYIYVSYYSWFQGIIYVYVIILFFGILWFKLKLFLNFESSSVIIY